MKHAKSKKDPKIKSTFLAFKASPDLVARLDAAVKVQDTDRSKFVRNAVRRALERAS
jgi:hypothetical protein